jgi:hypothetical protein
MSNFESYRTKKKTLFSKIMLTALWTDSIVLEYVSVKDFPQISAFQFTSVHADVNYRCSVQWSRERATVHIMHNDLMAWENSLNADWSAVWGQEKQGSLQCKRYPECHLTEQIIKSAYQFFLPKETTFILRALIFMYLQIQQFYRVLASGCKNRQ